MSVLSINVKAESASAQADFIAASALTVPIATTTATPVQTLAIPWLVKPASPFAHISFLSNPDQAREPCYRGSQKQLAQRMDEGGTRSGALESYIAQVAGNGVEKFKAATRSLG